MAMDCANELGLGTCFLGGIRFNADKVAKALGLSGSITPVVGMCVGYANSVADIRPKINKVYKEKYSLTQVKKEMKDYDKLMNKYYLKSFNKNYTFSSVCVKSLDQFDHNKTKELLEKQFKVK
ncbi:MAG: hypothetical protein K2M43_00885 [Mycoplasmoidaceae bacterium]|nr:hypothetical protein [Mycoplasmoidaceae bacterium]